jgi:integrase
MARKITEETRPDGSVRYRIQHPDPDRPGVYRSRRWDDLAAARAFNRMLDRGVGIREAIAADDAERPGKRTRPMSEGVTLVDYAARYVTAHALSWSAATTRAYAQYVNRLGEHEVGALALTEVGTPDVDALVRWYLARPGVSTRSAALFLGFLRRLYAYAIRLDDSPTDPARNAARVKVVDARKPVPMTMPEFHAVLSHVRTPAARALFTIMLHTGCRISEAMALTWEMVKPLPYHPEVQSVSVPGTKTDAAIRTTTIPTEVLAALLADGWLPERGSVNGGYLLPQSVRAYQAQWTKAVTLARDPETAAAAGFEPLTIRPRPHDLRHSHAVFLIMHGGLNLAQIKERMGHSSIKVTADLYGNLHDDAKADLGVLAARAMMSASA